MWNLDLYDGYNSELDWGCFLSMDQRDAWAIDRQPSIDKLTIPYRRIDF
jgi:hypothetical protein